MLKLKDLISQLNSLAEQNPKLLESPVMVYNDAGSCNVAISNVNVETINDYYDILDLVNCDDLEVVSLGLLPD